ncbi:MAG: hypothetical protein HQK99_08570 [Nitrospirae bacterium]|nr:hypothetical protein [Nitrospirota bacterium]
MNRAGEQDRDMDLFNDSFLKSENERIDARGPNYLHGNRTQRKIDISETLESLRNQADAVSRIFKV